MKSPLPSRLKWVVALCSLGTLFSLLIFHYNSWLWIKTVNLYGFLHDPCQLKTWVSSFGPWSPLVFIAIQVIQVIVAPIPGGAIEFLGGYLFGMKGGLLYSMIGLTLGSWAAFTLGRTFEHWAVEKFVSPDTLRKFDYLIGHGGAILSFVLFLIPGFPKDALCYILGLTSMHLGIFLIISTIGRIPGTLMATLQGAKAFDQQYVTMVILLGISSLAILVFYFYHEQIHHVVKKWKKTRSQINLEDQP